MISIKTITVIGEELAISWEDGLENYIPLDKLRVACPCAECQGEPDALGRVLKPEVRYSDNSMRLISFEEIGGYAINFVWADGHKTGLYSYQLLRSFNG